MYKKNCKTHSPEHFLNPLRFYFWAGPQFFLAQINSYKIFPQILIFLMLTKWLKEKILYQSKNHLSCSLHFTFLSVIIAYLFKTKTWSHHSSALNFFWFQLLLGKSSNPLTGLPRFLCDLVFFFTTSLFSCLDLQRNRVMVKSMSSGDKTLSLGTSSSCFISWPWASYLNSCISIFSFALWDNN